MKDNTGANKSCHVKGTAKPKLESYKRTLQIDLENLQRKKPERDKVYFPSYEGPANKYILEDSWEMV